MMLLKLKDLISQKDTLCLFDYDLTLYGNDEAHVLHSMDIYISEYVQKCFQCDFTKANAIRKEYWQKYGTTLAGLQKHWSCDPNHYFDYIHSGEAIQKPQANPKLQSFLHNLPNEPWIFTNGRADWAIMGLDAMGITFPKNRILDIEHFQWLGKPHPIPYQLVKKAIPPTPQILFFDDKIENLLEAQNHDWVTILVGSTDSRVDFCIQHVKELYD